MLSHHSKQNGDHRNSTTPVVRHDVACLPFEYYPYCQTANQLITIYFMRADVHHREFHPLPKRQKTTGHVLSVELFEVRIGNSKPLFISSILERNTTYP